MNRATERRNGVSFDPRTTAEVESDKQIGRDMTNGKPYRGKADKLEARNFAAKNERGYFTSSVPVQYHPPMKRGG